MPEGGWVRAPDERYARRRDSRSGRLVMVQVLSHSGEGASQVAARRARCATDQMSALVDGVAVLLVQSDDGSLLARQPSVASIQRGIELLGLRPIRIGALPHPGPGD